MFYMKEGVKGSPARPSMSQSTVGLASNITVGIGGADSYSLFMCQDEHKNKRFDWFLKYCVMNELILYYSLLCT